jgi:hypothetical protein
MPASLLRTPRLSWPWPSATGQATKKVPRRALRAPGRAQYDAGMHEAAALLLAPWPAAAPSLLQMQKNECQKCKTAKSGAAKKTPAWLLQGRSRGLMQPPLPSCWPWPPLPLPPAAAGPAAARAAASEFRAAWVATVANIDWPSKPGLSAQAQRDEAMALLDRARAIGLNAIVLQVRPAADAIYPSALEPWSEVPQRRTGPRPGLPASRPGTRWPSGCRSAPARAGTARLVQPLPRTPLVGQVAAGRHAHGVRQPALVKAYGDMLWMDPGEPEAAPRTRWPWWPTCCAATTWTACTSTTTSTPTPCRQAPWMCPSPTTTPTQRYRLGGGTLARDDWRRSNVDGWCRRCTRVHSHQALGARGHQPLRPGPARPAPAGHQRLQPVRQALCRRRNAG